MYEVFEHTADLGMRVISPDLKTLFTEAAQGLFAMIVENPEDINLIEERSFEVAGDDRVYLLFDWLNELLYTSESEHLLLRQFDIELNETGLKAVARGEHMDPDRHRTDHEVKAITYHGLRVDQQEDGWIAEVIVDI
jgi:SHS2 domain-containing protein